MINRILILITIAAWSILGGCERQYNSVTENSSNSTVGSFDAELAKELGADDYGMREYVMRF